jgi:hypothetical protein
MTVIVVMLPEHSNFPFLLKNGILRIETYLTTVCVGNRLRGFRD